MQVLIKKFTLLRDGIEYKAGTILELPEAEAEALVAGAPKEFEKVSVAVVVNSTTSAEKAEKTLKDFTNTELKALCEERGLEVPKAANKAKLLELLEGAADQLEGADGDSLPPVDTAATVK